MAALVPELYVTDLAASLRFYVGTCGFRVVYERPEERFAFLALGEAELMVEEPTRAARTFLAGPLERPFGRGMNLQIDVPEVEAIVRRCLAAAATIVLPLEERWYRRDRVELGVRQFVVADPDGYLLRFAQDLGERPAAARSE